MPKFVPSDRWCYFYLLFRSHPPTHEVGNISPRESGISYWNRINEILKNSSLVNSLWKCHWRNRPLLQLWHSLASMLYIRRVLPSINDKSMLQHHWRMAEIQYRSGLDLPVCKSYLIGQQHCTSKRRKKVGVSQCKGRLHALGEDGQ